MSPPPRVPVTASLWSSTLALACASSLSTPDRTSFYIHRPEHTIPKFETAMLLGARGVEPPNLKVPTGLVPPPSTPWRWPSLCPPNPSARLSSRPPLCCVLCRGHCPSLFTQPPLLTLDQHRLCPLVFSPPVPLCLSFIDSDYIELFYL